VYIEDTFGIAVGWFVVISLVVVALGCALMYHTKQHVRRLKVNFRIILGAIQVWSLLPAVLQLAFPGSSGLILHYFALFVFDLRDVVRLECWGWDWKSRWWASVLLLPLVASVPITAFWLWQQKKIRKLERASMKRAYKRARDQVIGAFLFLAMLLYPQLSSAILSALRCRKLGPELSVLEADYSQDCIIDTVNGTSVFAYGLLFLVPLGLPAFLFALLRTQRKDSARKWDFGVASGRMPPDMIAIVQADGSQRDFQHKKAEDFFGFCVEDYRKDCYWYEPVDMLRKLALSGLLQFVHRGTAAQCFCGCGIAFTSFGLQQWLQPYREWESNVLKACVDTQLFLTFLISFILRVLPQMEMDTAEPLQEADYGWLLVGSLVLLLIAFVGLTISEARRTKIWVASTVTFLSKKFERIISDRIQHVDTSDGPLEPLDRDGSSFVSDQATASTDAAAADKFAQDATVALLDVNRSRASSLDEADETFDLEPEPEPEGVQLGFLSGAE
jgi:membrane protein YdbS with pleckstrin-like domain/nitrate reductase NapE component